VVDLKLELDDSAKQDFYKCEPALQQKLLEKLTWFLQNDVLPEPLEGNFKGFYKLRVGDYRIVYEFETPTTMLVRMIAHRSRVYKDLARLLKS
jgi:mRNA interferase RelE/StbE